MLNYLQYEDIAPFFTEYCIFKDYLCMCLFVQCRKKFSSSKVADHSASELFTLPLLWPHFVLPTVSLLNTVRDSTQNPGGQRTSLAHSLSVFSRFQMFQEEIWKRFFSS